jgi:cardiolipin synthase
MRAYFERELADSLQITPEVQRRRGTFLRRLKWAISYFLVNVMDYTVTRRLNFRPER